MTELLREQERIKQRNKEIQELCFSEKLALGRILVCSHEVEGLRYRCPCCCYKTLASRGSYDICSVCFWEDDGQDDHDADTILGGPNHRLSLTKARENFRKIGACEERFLKFTRPPLPEEE
ncbi:CPCC family cysteine-rich protein [Ktedonobacter sp. SOSP1-85]|uniref:CPCC family cysteine-rich protein n=1 Tax=Ktedonobacter sp. SOSP1-85 TaxID=2778367 RepID=UPI001915FF72|nr:CPCC family cysteine-rich protein [Ktedonobacter sp. SOSP1-85]